MRFIRAIRKLHRHRWRLSTYDGVIHAYCVTCNEVTFNPRWPMWKEDNYE